MPAWLVALVGLISMAAGTASGIVGTRLALRKDKRDAIDTEIKKAEADDKAADRIIDLVKDQYAIALENERLKYEAKLQEYRVQQRQEIDAMRVSIRAEMKEEIKAAVDEALDTKGCDFAEDCDKRVAPKRRDPSI